jgi:hypothetical protein
MTRFFARGAGLSAVSGFLPSTLSGLVGWWDAADASTVTIATNVSEWRSKVGKFKAVQATANNQPLYQAAQQNGRNAVYFDGVNDFLSMGDMSSLFPSAASVLVAYRPDSDTEYAAIQTTANADFWVYGAGTSYIGTFKGTRLNGVSSTLPTSGNTIVAVTSDASNYRVYLNNAIAHDAAADFSAGTQHLLGNGGSGSALMKGWIYEVAYYSRTLSTAELKALSSYISSMWGY